MAGKPRTHVHEAHVAAAMLGECDTIRLPAGMAQNKISFAEQLDMSIEPSVDQSRCVTVLV
eukprot:scaffold146960_cov30-Tisochrysis_lutea.AAC.7